MANEFKVKNGIIISGSADIEQNLTVRGTLTADQYNVSIVSTSILYESGSTKFGDTSDDTHEFTGSVLVNGKVNASSLTGSLSFNNLTNVPTLVSGSSQIIYSGLTGIPSGIVSGSSQISYTGITNIPSGIVSGSEQLTGSYDTRYVLSGSITQTTWDNIANKPSDIVSSSTQISTFGFLQTSSFNSFTSSYTTGSFTGSFIGDGSQLTNIPSSGVTGLNLNKIISGSVSASISPDKGLEINTNTIISGSLSISGTTEFGGDLVPRTARGATLGTNERPFRDLYLQSASINIQSDIIGGRNARISNADGNVTIQAAGFQLKSGSFVSFEISEEGLTTIQAPKQILGTESAFNIIGSLSGYQQPRNFSGSLIQLTAQDNQPARISLDSYGIGTYGLIAARSARGTVDTPTQTKSGDTLLRLTAQGWTNSNSFIGSIVRVNLEAAQDFTSTASGTKITLQTTPIGSTTIQTSATIDTTGINIPTGSDFKIGGNSYTASLATTGSNTFNGNQTITGSVNITGSLSITGLTAGATTDSIVTYNPTTKAVGSITGITASQIPTRYYGAFYDLTTQTGSTNVSGSVMLGNTQHANGVSVVSGSRITVANAGVYNLQFSTQLYRSQGGNTVNTYFWFRINGVNVTNSNTMISTMTNNNYTVASWNYVDVYNAGDYVELMWMPTGQHVSLEYINSPAGLPSIPSVILTLTQV
jgi:hypothetical protein